MNDMIKAERGKIISKKPTKILFVMGIILIVAYFSYSSLVIPLYSITTIPGKWTL